jgi:hypothetical protein
MIGLKVDAVKEKIERRESEVKIIEKKEQYLKTPKKQ